MLVYVNVWNLVYFNLPDLSALKTNDSFTTQLVTLIVNKNNTDSLLSVNDLRKILTGKIRSWKSLDKNSKLDRIKSDFIKIITFQEIEELDLYFILSNLHKKISLFSFASKSISQNSFEKYVWFYGFLIGKEMTIQRVLHIVGKMDRAGAETMLMNLYRHIDHSQIQFDFITFFALGHS